MATRAPTFEMKSYPTREAAVKALARALGYRGSAGGWIYRPAPEHAHLSAAVGVPAEWAGTQFVQGWRMLDQWRLGSWIARREDGRFTFDRARLEQALESTREESGKVYGRYLHALAESAADLDEQRRCWEGLRARVNGIYALLNEGRS